MFTQTVLFYILNFYGLLRRFTPSNDGGEVVIASEAIHMQSQKIKTLHAKE
jgi:hypothetical protein